MLKKVLLGILALIFVNNICAQNIKVGINKNIETLAIIYSLSAECSRFYTSDYTQIKDIANNFKQFKDHEVVRQTNKLIKNRFLNLGRLMVLGVNYEEVPKCKLKKGTSFRPVILETDTSMHIKNASKEFDRYMNLVNQFYEDAKLEQYFKSNEQVFNYAESEINKLLLGNNYARIMETFFGMHNFNFNISPSIHTPPYMNFGASSITQNGKEIYFIMGITDKDFNFTNYSNFKSMYYHSAYFTSNFLHEFCHSYVEATIIKDLNRAKINNLSFLNTNVIKDKLRKQGYGTEWSTCFEEHLVRSIEHYLCNEVGFKKESLEDKNTDFKDGFIYIDEFSEAIKDYAQNRERYKTFEDYFDTLTLNLQKVKLKETIEN